MPALKMALYVLAALWSGASAILLLRSYIQRRIPLLMWNSIFVAGLTLNNIALVINVLLPEFDLRLAQLIPPAIGTACLAYGFLSDKDAPHIRRLTSGPDPRVHR